MPVSYNKGVGIDNKELSGVFKPADGSILLAWMVVSLYNDSTVFSDKGREL